MQSSKISKTLILQIVLEFERPMRLSWVIKALNFKHSIIPDDLELKRLLNELAEEGKITATPNILGNLEYFKKEDNNV